MSPKDTPLDFINREIKGLPRGERDSPYLAQYLTHRLAAAGYRLGPETVSVLLQEHSYSPGSSPADPLEDPLGRRLARSMISEIAITENPGVAMRTLRETFDLAQRDVAGALGIGSSVISVYESDRRASPGTAFVRRYVSALLTASSSEPAESPEEAAGKPSASSERRRSAGSSGQHELLVEALREDMAGPHRYSHPEGLFYLSQDTGYTPHRLAALVGTPESFEALVGEAPPGSWNPRRISLTLADAESIVSLLRSVYGTDPTKLLQRYGNRAGGFFVAQDIPALAKKNPRLASITTLVPAGDIVARLIGTDDPRLPQEWRQQFITLGYADAEKIRSHLRAVHERDPERFYALCTGLIGGLALPKELARLDVHPRLSELTTALRTAETAADFLGLDSRELQGRWRSGRIGRNTERQEPLDAMTFVRRTYAKDPDAFFAGYYTDPLGALWLACDYAAETEEDVNIGMFSGMLKSGPDLGRLLKSTDPRFATKTRALDITTRLSDADQLREFLRGRYHEDKDAFFARYGGSDGSTAIQKDLAVAELPFACKPTPVQLNRFTLDGMRLARFLGIEDERFSGWRQRYVNTTPTQTEDVLAFLRERYHADKDAFFSRYGGTIGMANLEDDLAARGTNLSAFRLAQIACNPDHFQTALGIQDSRFETEWHPRSIQTTAADRRLLVETLVSAYRTDRIAFFARYGGPTGLYLLQQDVKAKSGRSVPAIQISSTVRDTTALSQLSGIPEADLKAHWRPQVLNLSERAMGSLGRYLREFYRSSPETFFTAFESGAGFFTTLNRFRAEGKDIPPPGALSSVLGSPAYVSLLVGADDPRFESWDPPTTSQSFSVREFEAAIDILRTAYRTSPDGFVERYGVPLGAANLAEDVSARGVEGADLGHAYSLLCDPLFLESALGASDSRFHEGWSPVSIRLTENKFRKIRSLLKSVYEEDADVFFGRYGSRTAPLILMKEAGNAGAEAAPREISDLVQPKLAAAIVDADADARFESDWKSPKMVTYEGKRNMGYRNVVRALSEGFMALADDATLPADPSSLPENHLVVRRLLRVAELPNAHYLTELYGGHRAGAIRRQLDCVVAANHKELASLDSIQSRQDIRSYGAARFAQTVGRLLYSPDEDVRVQTQAQLIRIFDPLVRGWRVVQQDPELYDAFSGACLRFDLALTNPGVRDGTAPFETFFRSTVYATNHYKKIAAWREEMRRGGKAVSLDNPRSEAEKEGDTFHEIIG